MRSAALANHIAVTHMRYDGPGSGLTEPVPPQPALLLAVQLKPLLKHELWLDGRALKVQPYAAGALTMLDLHCSPMANLASSYDCVQMYFARSALDELSDAEGMPRFGEFPLLNGADDPVLAHLAQIAAKAVSPVGPATPLFLESMALSVHRHLHRHYLGRSLHTPRRSGLAGWQERRSKDYIEAHLHGSIGLLELARHCQLSPSQFGRAFKQSVGMPPHQWIMSRRLARARILLVQQQIPLTHIARLSGFADASHLAREFRKSEGLTATQWRKLYAHRP